jgi:hypothetical protein
MDADRKFETDDLLDDIASHLGGDNTQQLLHSLLWEHSLSVARTQALYSVSLDAKTAWRALTEPSNDELREGHEYALWLRKLVEHLAMLVCFAERDESRDYWLWLALIEHQQMQRIITALCEELSITPTHEQLRVVGRLRTTALDVVQVAQQGVVSPWFITQAQWRQLLNGDADIVVRWRPPRVRQILMRPNLWPIPSRCPSWGIIN